MKAVQIIDTQLDALPVIAKHLKAMDEELQQMRMKSPYDWMDGMWADVPEVIVRASGSGDVPVLGKFIANEAGGYDFTQDDGD